MWNVKIICPSAHLWSLSDSEIRGALQFLEEKGLNVELMGHCKKVHWYCAWTTRERVVDIEEALIDNNTDIVISFWWWRNTNQLIDKLNYNSLGNINKIVVWNSDMTVLLLWLYKKLWLKTFYWPWMINFSKDLLREYTWKYFSMLFIEKVNQYELIPSEELHIDELEKIKNSGPFIFKRWIANWISIAWHAWTLLRLYWTEFCPSLENSILFIEFSEEQSMADVDRDLTQMHLLWIFKQIKWLVVGHFRSESNVTTLWFEEILRRVLSDIDIPVIYWCNFWHTYPIAIIPNWADCIMDTSNTAKPKILFSNFY